ncbi:MAG: fumarylacetoacetate hydrolase family protein [Thermoplasmata archaeon]|nr:fumarylacetoacetate hydrolase family protein [Thermoplasmata archaeon]
MKVWFRDRKIEFRPSKIVCVARNYSAHAAEMREEVPPDPVFFIKPRSALVPHGGTVVLPVYSNRVEHEVELAVVIKRRLKGVSVVNLKKDVLGFSIVLDMTARDIQGEAKKQGLPWTKAKCFDTSAPFGPEIVPPDKLDWRNLAISLKVNGGLRQYGNTSQMVFGVEELIASASEIFTLEKYDIIATGTPSGVGEVKPGDVVEAEISGIGKLRVRVSRPKIHNPSSLKASHEL